jgi:hypothetical protein
MMVDPWGLDDDPSFIGPPAPQEPPSRIHEGRGQSYVRGRWVDDPVRPVEVTSSRWHDAAANGFDANTPEGTPIALFGFMSAVPDYRYHAGKLVPSQDYQEVLYRAAADVVNHVLYPYHMGNPSAPIHEPEFDYSNIDESTAQELQAKIGPANGSIQDNSFEIFGIFTGAGALARAAVGALGRRLAVAAAAKSASNAIGTVTPQIMGAGGVELNTTQFVNLASPQRTRHILYGDATGGGHMFPGAAGKSSFPQDWSAARIMHEISDVATDPLSTSAIGRGGRTIVTGTRGGINLKVILGSPKEGGGIITGFPTNVLRNP